MVGRDGVVVAEEDQVLVFVLAQGLGYFWFFDHGEDGLGFVLEALVCGYGRVAFGREFYTNRQIRSESISLIAYGSYLRGARRRDAAARTD